MAEARTAPPVAGTAAPRLAAVWGLCAATVLAQVAYPLTSGGVRDRLTVAIVLLFCTAAVVHAATTRGIRVAAVLVAVAGGGGLLAEAVGTSTGWPFGAYSYAGSLGPRLLGVPVVIPLAWTMMAWPAWLVAGRLLAGPLPGGRLPGGRLPGGRLSGRSRWVRVPLAGWALASWDLFLDPQMVAAGHWTWADPTPALPGVGGVPVSNYLAWVAVATVMTAALAAVPGTTADAPTPPGDPADAPMHVVYLWTYGSSVLAHLVFFGLPASALWGGLGMGTVAVPLAVLLLRARRARLTSPR